MMMSAWAMQWEVVLSLPLLGCPCSETGRAHTRLLPLIFGLPSPTPPICCQHVDLKSLAGSLQFEVTSRLLWELVLSICVTTVAAPSQLQAGQSSCSASPRSSAPVSPVPLLLFPLPSQLRCYLSSPGPASRAAFSGWCLPASLPARLSCL